MLQLLDHYYWEVEKYERRMEENCSITSIRGLKYRKFPSNPKIYILYPCNWKISKSINIISCKLEYFAIKLNWCKYQASDISGKKNPRDPRRDEQDPISKF